MAKSVNERTILDFIDNFKDANATFLSGCCYWFAFILQARFGGTMMYEQVANHFIQEIGGRLYDVSGDVTDKYQPASLMRWVDMEEYDPLLYQRIVRDCIDKDRWWPEAG